VPAIRTARAYVVRYGPRVRDVVFIAAALLTAFAVVVNRPSWPRVPRVPLALFGLVGSLALWWRRRWPVEVTLIGIGLAIVGANPVTMAVGLFTTAIRRRDRVLLALAVATAVAITLPDAVDHGGVAASTVLGAVLIAGFIVAAGAYIGARRDLLATLRERAERAEAERELRAAQARVAERSRIAREMHDVLAHKVSLIALHAGALEVNSSLTRGGVEEAAALIRATARQALEELRDVLGMLRDESMLDSGDLRPTSRAADIERLVDSSRAAGVQAELVNEVRDLPDATARTVYRVVQEALTNVHKHARGAATMVTIRGDAERGVTVSIVNRRPVGADTLLPGSGAGLLGLRERMRLVGGRLTSGARPDGGWEVVAWLPWSGFATDAGSDAGADAALPPPVIGQVPTP